MDQKDIIFLTNRGAGNEGKRTLLLLSLRRLWITDAALDGRIAAVSKEGISVKGVSIGSEGFLVEGNRGYVRLSIERQ